MDRMKTKKRKIITQIKRKNEDIDMKKIKNYLHIKSLSFQQISQTNGQESEVNTDKKMKNPILFNS